MLAAVQITRPAAVLLALSALVCFLLAASSVPYAFALDAGVIAFYAGMGALYALAALRIWRRDKSGAWVLAVVLLLWAVVTIREGHLPAPELAVAFLAGPVLALAAWRELVAPPTDRSPLIAGSAIIGLLAVVTAATAPLWHCHEGFGGRSDYHCHSVIVREHAH